MCRWWASCRAAWSSTRCQRGFAITSSFQEFTVLPACTLPTISVLRSEISPTSATIASEIMMRNNFEAAMDRALGRAGACPSRFTSVTLNLKSAVQRLKHLAEAKCTEEACLRRGHSPKVNPKGAQACARRGGSMDFLMESGFMHWMSERMSFTNWVKADFHETSRITLKFSAPPRLRERYRLGAGSSRYGNCFF